MELTRELLDKDFSLLYHDNNGDRRPSVADEQPGGARNVPP
jgi:hypothetical protein